MTPPVPTLVQSYNYGLVALSIVISILGAYAARDMAERVKDALGGRAWVAWLAAAAAVNGINIWSMHFTGMLAFNLPVMVKYDWPTVSLSLVMGVIGSGAALWVLSCRNVSWGRALAASIFLGGVGISGLHYTAMGAMRLPAMCHHSPALVTLSVALAIVISLMSLVLTYDFRPEAASRGLRTHLSALLQGAANPVMHYTAMAGVTFAYSAQVPDFSNAVNIASLGILGITIVPVMVLVVGVLSSMVDQLHRQRALLDELFEQAPAAVALTDANDQVVRVNREFARLFGYRPTEVIGRRLGDLIASGEAREEAQRFASSVTQGQRVEAEGVRQRKDGSRLQVAMLHVPVSVPGGQIAAYRMYRDITQRERAEEELRHSYDQLRLLTARLESLREDERTRISREIHDELGQKLTGLKMDLLRAERQLGEMENSLAMNLLLERILGATELVDDILTSVQEISAELRPGVLDKLGLGAALQYECRRFEERTGIRCTVHLPATELVLPPELSTGLFRIFQECLTNVARHAQATRVEVELKSEARWLILTVEDDGRGITEADLARAESLGVLGMRERATLLGGEVQFQGGSQGGTRVLVRVPFTGGQPRAGEASPKA